MTQQEQEFSKKILKITYGKLAGYFIGVAAVCFSVIKGTIMITLAVTAAKENIIEKIEAEKRTNIVQDAAINNIKVTTDLHTMQIEEMRKR